MTTDDHPAGEPLVGHIALTTGELVTVSTIDDQVALALDAARRDGETASDGDTQVVPAPVIVLDADECEVLGSLLTYAAVALYGRRRRLRAVSDEDGEHR